MKKTTVFILSIVLLFSCNKDPKDECTTNVTSLSTTYKITGYTYKPTPTSPEQDYFTILFPDACDRDNNLTLSSNGTYVITDVGMVCTPSGADNGVWTFTGNSMTIDGEPTVIESFNCQTLVISFADFMTTGDKMKITLVKQ